MQFLPRMSTLLASLVVLFSLWQPVLSLAIARSDSKFLTFPIKRMEHRRSDVHPQILPQMRINRGIQRRLAKMTDAKSRRQVLTAAPPTAPNSLGLDYDISDGSYLATIEIGTPSRNFSILMDSGSANFWVGSENCSTEGGNNGCGNHTFLGPQSSSSFTYTGGSFNITYGTGQAVGSSVNDNVHIAGLSLTDYTFGVANFETPDFSNSSYDGVMGLAKSSLSVQNTPTPIEALASLGLVAGPIVSYKLGRSLDQNDGEITFGGLDPSKFVSSTLVTLPNVDPVGFWAAKLDNVSVNGVDLGLNLNDHETIFDTGTTLMMLPEVDALAIHENIPGARPIDQGYFTVPCNTSAVVALTYAGQPFTIDTRDLARQPVNSNDPNGDCLSGIAAINSSDLDVPVWIVGDTFLKNVYFSTDVSQDTISLAKLV